MNEHFYDTREEASLAAAEHIARALGRRLGLQAEASLVVSGGTTPERCFEILAHRDIDWARVHVLLSDERWVPADHESSNERLVRTTLLKNGASAARLLPAYASDIELAAGAAALDEAIRARPFPFAAALLGMGTDGHFASLFPDADNLDDGLDAESGTLSIPIVTAASPHPRISLTLAALSRSDEIQLLIFGEEKRAVYEAAKARGCSAYPVASLLRQKRAPVHVIWAP
jgi:6-phosphogluconolactonase